MTFCVGSCRVWRSDWPSPKRTLPGLRGHVPAALESTPAGVYATLFLAILDPRSKTLRYVNAGHHRSS